MGCVRVSEGSRWGVYVGVRGVDGVCTMGVNLLVCERVKRINTVLFGNEGGRGVELVTHSH